MCGMEKPDATRVRTPPDDQGSVAEPKPPRGNTASKPTIRAVPVGERYFTLKCR